VQLHCVWIEEFRVGAEKLRVERSVVVGRESLAKAHDSCSWVGPTFTVVSAMLTAKDENAQIVVSQRRLSVHGKSASMECYEQRFQRGNRTNTRLPNSRAFGDLANDQRPKTND